MKKEAANDVKSYSWPYGKNTSVVALQDRSGGTRPRLGTLLQKKYSRYKKNAADN